MKVLNLTAVMVDGSFVKVHQHAVGARRGERDPDESRAAPAIGKTKGGLNTNLLALADNNGRLVRFSLLPGNSFEAHHLASSLRDFRFRKSRSCCGTRLTTPKWCARCWPQW